MSYGRGPGGFPDDAGAPGGRKIPGGKAGGGGIMTLLIIGALFYFMFGGFGQGVNQNQDPQNQEDQGGGFDAENWRPQQADNDRRHKGFDIDGDINPDKAQNDRVETKDGWSMEDADASKNSNRGFEFSNKPKEPVSDEVKNKDGWKVKDATTKGKKEN